MPHTIGAILMFGLGVQELLIIFAIILVIFGASKLPQLGRGLGEGIRNFKVGLKGDEQDTLDEGGSEKSEKTR
jgi:sec-independent protein translocase protein TatA